MGMRKADLLWPKPKSTRHVWVDQKGPHSLMPPIQGFVERRRYNYRWWALALTVAEPKEGPPLTTMERLRAEKLTPVKSDPNDG